MVNDTKPRSVFILCRPCAMMLILTKEVLLPHSPRVVAFLDHDTACFAYSATDHALFQLSTMTATDIVYPPPTITASSTAKGALTGFSGYMSLGFGAKAKACAVAIDEREALLVRDSKLPVRSPTKIEMLNFKDQGIFIGKDGKPSRLTNVEWPVAPEETSWSKCPLSYLNANSSYSVHQALYCFCSSCGHSACAIYWKLLG